MLKYWLWLSSLKGIGTSGAVRVLRRFGSPRDVYFAAAAEYRQVEGLQRGEIDALSNKSFNDAEKIMEDCENGDIQIVTLQDSIYPERLRNIYDPPLVLYVKGRLPVIDEEPAVAVVGSRDATPYGIVTAERLGTQIVEHGGIVVSGLARGIDSGGHRGALKAGGVTVAVLGCGADVVYPKENQRLYDDIVAAGAVISEFPPGSGVLPGNFPRRNRIMSGLCISVVVVEAPEKSGALITASLAAEQGREVFAVPGNIDAPQSTGCNALIRDGAPLAGSGWEILREYAPLFPDKICERPKKKYELMSKKPITPPAKEVGAETAKKLPDIDQDALSQDERDIFELLCASESPQHIDDIIEAVQIPASRVLSALTLLELGGAVIQEKNKRFRLRS